MNRWIAYRSKNHFSNENFVNNSSFSQDFSNISNKIVSMLAIPKGSIKMLNHSIYNVPVQKVKYLTNNIRCRLTCMSVSTKQEAHVSLVDKHISVVFMISAKSKNQD